MKDNKVIFIFVRRFNDIDHIAPIVYKLGLETSHNIHLICLNPLLDIFNDERIKFLIKSLNKLSVGYVYSYSTGFIRRSIANIFFIPFTKKKFKRFFWIMTKVPPKLMTKKYSQFIQLIFNKNWANRIMDQYKPSILIFDWAKKYQYCVGTLVDAADDKGIPTIAVPHGLNLSLNDKWTESSDKYGKFDQLLGHFDKVVLPYEGQKDWYIKNNFPREKLKVIGSTRYSSEWMSVYRSFSLDDEIKYFSDESSLKIVFMEYPYNYRINEKIVSEDIRLLSEIDGVEMIIKPHTRNNKVYSEKLLDSRIKIDNQTPSIKLIAQADVVIGTTSSIFLDVLLNDIAFIYPKYFHENIMLYETMEACWAVEDWSQLKSAIKKLKLDPSYRPYKAENINKLKRYVVDGSGDKNVLGRYTRFIQQTIDQAKT